MSSIDDLIEEFDDAPYTRERFDADRARLIAVLCAKHGVAASEVDTLIKEHRYAHSFEDPEDEYIQIMALARAAGWLESRGDSSAR
jgi:hypothetical protein